MDPVTQTPGTAPSLGARREVTSVAFSDSATGEGLLRVRGPRAAGESADSCVPKALRLGVVGEGGSLAALPDADCPSGGWGAAFLVERQQLEQAAVRELQWHDGTVLPLPEVILTVAAKSPQREGLGSRAPATSAGEEALPGQERVTSSELTLLQAALDEVTAERHASETVATSLRSRAATLIRERDDLHHALRAERTGRKRADQRARKRKAKTTALKARVSELASRLDTAQDAHARELRQVLDRLSAALATASDEKQARLEARAALRTVRTELEELRARVAISSLESGPPSPATVDARPAMSPSRRRTRFMPAPKPEPAPEPDFEPVPEPAFESVPARGPDTVLPAEPRVARMLPRPVAESDLVRRIGEQAAAAAGQRAPETRAARIAADLDAAAAALRAAADIPEADDVLPLAPRPAPPLPRSQPAGSGQSSARMPAMRAAVDTARARVLPSLELATITPSAGALTLRRRSAQVAESAPTSRMRGTLVALAARDPFAAARLIVGLLPAQAAWVDGTLDYDLTIRELGTFAVTLSGGRAEVTVLGRPRSRRAAELHLAAPALALAELITGHSQSVGRMFSAVRLRGPRRRLEPLLELGHAAPSFVELARAGARLDPALMFKALPYAIDPDWVSGRRFTIAHEITGPRPQRWFVRADGSSGVSVTSALPQDAPDASVRMSRAAFDRLMRADAPAPGDKPAISGDFRAVEQLREWCERARLGSE